MTVKEKAAAMKIDSPQMAATTIETRNTALKAIAEALLAKKEQIFAENEKDLEEAKRNQIPEAVVKRLKFSEQKLQDCVKGIENLILVCYKSL